MYISCNVYNIFCNDIFFIYNTIEKLQNKRYCTTIYCIICNNNDKNIENLSELNRTYP